jgi:hypothetical protein
MDVLLEYKEINMFRFWKKTEALKFLAVCMMKKAKILSYSEYYQQNIAQWNNSDSAYIVLNSNVKFTVIYSRNIFWVEDVHR